MRSQEQRAGFRSAGTALIRAVAHARPDLPPWPDLTDLAPERVASWVDWLRSVWAIDDVAEALEHASPDLAQQVRSLCSAEGPTVRDTRRAALSVARYLQRMVGRATPFGLLAGVASASFGATPRQRWGGHHRAVACAGAQWLADIIAALEGCPDLLSRLPVVVNSTLMVRGNRLIVPYQPKTSKRRVGAVEVSLRFTAAVHAAVEAAGAPITVADLTAKIQAEFPTAASKQITSMLAELVARRVMITSLHAPSTEPDALGHLVEQLRAVDGAAVVPVADLVARLEEIHTLLDQHNQLPVNEGRKDRADVAARMHRLSRAPQHPLAIDLRLDATTVLPYEVAREVERAALVLTRLSAYPVGTPSWRAYHQRFYERYGIGSMVPLLDVVSDSGIGWPDGYPDTVTPERRSPMSSRDERLLTLAQSAALDGRDEVELDERLLKELELGSEQLRPPPHLELGVRVHATDQDALQRGEFTIEVVTVSRAAGVLTGRFLSVLEPHERAVLVAGLTNLPGGDANTLVAQLSFPPLDPATAHVTRAMRTLPMEISLAEHRPPSEQVLTPENLAVSCDGRRMYLAAPALGKRVEAVGMHALNLLTHTPPLARFLIELSRAQCAQVTTFDWGAGARMPYLPRLRHGRIVVSPAKWRLVAAELPPRQQPPELWDQALTAWRTRRRLPRLVHLTKGDRLLPLDLDHAGHRALLRTHLDSEGRAVLTEAPPPDSAGWCGGRPHEVIVPLVAVKPPSWPRLPRPTRARIISRDHGCTPGASRLLLVSLYGDLHRQNVILAEYLPVLIAQLPSSSNWWYIRYRDPDQHLRLRVDLPDIAKFGEVACIVSTWAEDLRRAGLVSEVTYPTSYPETGRWGSGAAMRAAEAVFAADSQALLVELGQPVRPHPRALAAAHAVAISIAFAGSTAVGMRWLIEHVAASAPARVPRPVYAEAVHIADPRDEFAGLRAAPGGTAIARGWTARDRALARYRAFLPGPETQGIAVDDVLGSLMHVNFVRACGIDFDQEAVCLYLARAAALAWTARTEGGHL